MEENVVTIPCVCPGSPHESDTVTLKDPLSFRDAATMRASILLLDDLERADNDLVLAVLDETYLVHGIGSWTLVDAQGEPVPVTGENVELALLSHVPEAMQVADKAEDLYNASVLLPLVERGQRLSGRGPTQLSTSPTNGSSPKPRTHSSQSSTSTSRTDATGTTSRPLVGGSK